MKLWRIKQLEYLCRPTLSSRFVFGWWLFKLQSVCSLSICLCLCASCLSKPINLKSDGKRGKKIICFEVRLQGIWTCDMNQITFLLMWNMSFQTTFLCNFEKWKSYPVNIYELMPHVFLHFNFLVYFNDSEMYFIFLFFRNKKKTKVQLAGQNITLISSIQWQL